MAEQTKRVQLTLPECKRLADILFDEVRDVLGIPEVIDDKPFEITRGKWIDALPKIQRAIKMTAEPVTRKKRKGLDRGPLDGSAGQP